MFNLDDQVNCYGLESRNQQMTIKLYWHGEAANRTSCRCCSLFLSPLSPHLDPKSFWSLTAHQLQWWESLISVSFWVAFTSKFKLLHCGYLAKTCGCFDWWTIAQKVKKLNNLSTWNSVTELLLWKIMVCRVFLYTSRIFDAGFPVERDHFEHLGFPYGIYDWPLCSLQITFTASHAQA